MIKRIRAGVLAALVAVASTAGCADMENNPKGTVGSVLGGVAGAVIGSQFGDGTGQLAATAAGTLIGAALGGSIGRSLDRADRLYAQQAQQQAYQAPMNETIQWSNPDSGNEGSFTPVREGTNQQTGEYCRQYRTTVVIDGAYEEAYGTACRQSDGSWRIVDG